MWKYVLLSETFWHCLQLSSNPNNQNSWGWLSLPLPMRETLLFFKRLTITNVGVIIFIAISEVIKTMDLQTIGFPTLLRDSESIHCVLAICWLCFFNFITIQGYTWFGEIKLHSYCQNIDRVNDLLMAIQSNPQKSYYHLYIEKQVWEYYL